MNNLKDWLQDIRNRGCTITIDNHIIHVRGPAAQPDDLAQTDRHRHTLTTATNRTHPHWWTYVSTHNATPPRHLDDIPVAHTDPDAFACTTCGGPSAHLDHHLLAWCNQHRTEVAA